MVLDTMVTSVIRHVPVGLPVISIKDVTNWMEHVSFVYMDIMAAIVS